ncbi:hypothetical protein JG491_33525 [Streptomyces sp. CRPSP2-6A1]|uniref:hypothetical protein n=1 Tax=Streptomyces TaxID=1883 RepID=UPI0018F09EC4|nr:hypothetical protein [Streptomyces sp. CRPSP2-6A1]MBJ7004926.1 hypothetical protein [Streptomyces sp. CRPSP2-6A1]
MPDGAAAPAKGAAAPPCFGARNLAREAAAAGTRRREQANQDTHDRLEATWRERALNAEEELTRTQKEILTQRQRIGELMGQLRDFEQMVPGESVQALVSENSALKQRVRQLTQEHRTLQERLEGARSNNRFAEKCIADLEAQLVELQNPIQPVFTTE